MSDYSRGDLESAPGRLLAGRYRLERLIGSGASAHVYAATDELLQLPVAIKILHDAADADRQIRESTLAMSLNHPTIVGCHGAFSEDDKRFIVMELAEGESLAERLLRAPLALDETIAVLRSVAEALHHAHERGVLHRDIAPGNILTVVTDDRVVGARVIDFGIAKEIETTLSHTQTVGIGTAAYAAPEQLTGHPTEQSDLYGLGAVLFHMLCGAPPALGRGGIFLKLPSATPAWLADLSRHLLAFDAQQRIRSAQELLARIPSAPGRSISVGVRRTLIAFSLVTVALLLTAALLITFSMDARYRAGQICSWLERKQLVSWTNPRVLGTMAMAAATVGDIATLERLFTSERMPPERTEWLLADCLEAAIQRGQVDAVGKLIDLGAKVATDNQALATQLITDVSISRSPETLQLLVKRGMNMRPVFEQANPFTISANKGDLRMFQTLLTLLDSYEELPPLHDPPLWAAVTSNNPESYIPPVRASGPRIINARDRTGAHALIRALHNLSLPTLRRLLAIPELDLEQPSADGSSALIFAAGTAPEETPAGRADRLEACKLLLSRGANVNTRNKVGNRPLLIAAELQLLELTRILLDHPDIELNAQDIRGDTALHRAINPSRSFTPEILKLLLSRGADLEQANALGETPRQLARRVGREHLLDGAHE